MTLAVHIDQLVVAMMDMEEEGFEKILGNLILRYGFEKTVTEIVYPFLEKIGILWQTQNITPAHEHFISNLIRQKIIVAIDGLAYYHRKLQRRFCFSFPRVKCTKLGCCSIITLLAKPVCVRTTSDKVCLMRILYQFLLTHSPDLLVTSVTSTLAPSIENYFEQLSNDFPLRPILMSGIQVRDTKGLRVGNVQTFTTALELIKYL